MQPHELHLLIRQVMRRYEDISLGNACLLSAATILQGRPLADTTPQKVLEYALELYAETQKQPVIPATLQP